MKAVCAEMPWFADANDDEHNSRWEKSDERSFASLRLTMRIAGRRDEKLRADAVIGGCERGRAYSSARKRRREILHPLSRVQADSISLRMAAKRGARYCGASPIGML
jgi:hypothetical protein